MDEIERLSREEYSAAPMPSRLAAARNVSAVRLPGYLLSSRNVTRSPLSLPSLDSIRNSLQDDPERSTEILKRIPAARWGETADLQGAAVFLASSASNYINGHILAVDGGFLAR